LYGGSAVAGPTEPGDARTRRYRRTAPRPLLLSIDVPKDRPSSGKRHGAGRAQLTLLEHALCPLDTSASLARGLIHRSEFFLVDETRRRRKASAEVICPFGLSPADEFYLWGLVALTLSQPEPTVEFYATPHYCLTELGVIDARAGQGGRGGKNYALFRHAIARLAGVTYVNDRFYDPIRGEHRAVAFGFLSYSLPIDPASSRAWRIAWDPIFFEFCQAARGSLVFDLATYRDLDFASRRLFLLLKKIFYRNPHSPRFDARHLGVNVLGFAPTIDVWNLKAKLAQCARRLAEFEVVALPEVGPGTKGLFEKKGVGEYTIRFQRGRYFERNPSAEARWSPSQSALHGPLKSIGLDDATIARVLGKYKPHLIQVWADITLAAREKSPGFFKVGPQAYFMDSIDKASRGSRRPPDWWYAHRKEQDRRDRESRHAAGEIAPPIDPRAAEAEAFDDYLAGEAKAAFGDLVERLQSRYEESGQSRREALRSASESARIHMKHRFMKDHPEFTGDAPRSLGDVLKAIKLP
jgi:hypothetical protein